MSVRRMVASTGLLGILLAAVAGARATAGGSHEVEVASWHAAADGGALTLRVDGASYRLALVDNPLLTPEAVAGLAEHGFDATRIRTLGGSVAGMPGSVVRVTVTDHWAAGLVIAGGRRLEIVPVRGGALARAERGGYRTGRVVDYEPGDRSVPGPADDHLLGCTSATPHRAADPSGLSSGWPAKTLSMAVATDAAFVAANGSGWPAVATAIINGVDGVFEQVDVDISIVDLHGHGSQIDGTNTSTFLTSLRTHYTNSHPTLAREDTALLLAKPLSGTAIGQANCIGGAGDKDVAYQVSQTKGLDPISIFGVVFYSNAVVKTAAHELGHIFNAHHHYANCVESSRTPIADACTLMINFVDFLDEAMGSLERLVMRGWAEDFI